MAAKLVAEEGSLKGLVLSLEDGEQWVIGRDPDACQLLVEAPSTSRKHLICRTTPEGILVENLSTTNPTQINDEAVTSPRLLQNGDTVKIGDELFRFYAEEAAQLFKEGANANNGTGEDKNGALPSLIEEQPTPAKEQQPEKEEKKEEQQPPMSQAELVQEETVKAAPEAPPPPAPPKKKPPEEKHEERHDTIYDEEPSEKNVLAEINFGFLDTGRWLLKVVGGPNNGAEFSLQTGSTYVLGTDPNTCDIVFHDTSVSRQHARVTVAADDTLMIEDLKSRNGTVIDGETMTVKRNLPANIVVSLGTTSFVIFDREGEMQTIISPLMPSIVKVLQKEESKEEEEKAAAAAAAKIAATTAEAKPPEAHHSSTLGAFILIGILTGLFVIVGIGTSTLFKSEPVVVAQTVDPMESLDAALSPFPSVKYSFNKNTGQLLLVGHVLTPSDRSQLLYTLRGMKFIKGLDDSGIVIDEYVWREINQVIEKNPEWRGINVMATSPGHFVVSGYLQKRNQAEHLSEYLSANFPYPDLLEKRVIVDEEVNSSINNVLQTKNFKTVTAKFDNGEVVLTGTIPPGRNEEFDAILASIKEIKGVRGVRNMTVEQAPEQTFVNISDQYDVTGISNFGGRLSVVINGRILMKGDSLDGMLITNIQSNYVFLEKDGVRYRIDYNR